MKNELEHLAKIKEPEARSQLVRMLVSQYSQAVDREPNENEKELFSNIVLCVFDQLDRDTRYELVVRLAKTDRINTELAHRLAQEDIELSEPVITHSPVISLETLKQIARRGPEAKREAMAKRADLTEDITDTLVAKSARKVVHMLLKNPDVPFSDRAVIAMMIFANTEAEMLASMAERAMNDARFRQTQEAIVESHEPLVPAPLARALRKDELAKLTRNIQIQADNDEVTIDGVAYCRHEASVQIANGELSFDAILKTLCEQNRMDVAIWHIARKLSMKPDLVRDALKSDSDGAVMLLMLQTGIDDRTYRVFLKTRCAWLDRSTRSVPDMVMRFKKQQRSVPQETRISA